MKTPLFTKIHSSLCKIISFSFEVLLYKSIENHFHGQPDFLQAQM